MAQGAAQVKVITTVGKNLKLSSICGLANNPVKYIALGIGDTADAAVGNTALESMIVDSGLSVAEVTPTVVGAVATWTYTWTATASKHITEIGLLGGNPGILYMRITLGSGAGLHIDLVAGDVFKVTITDTET
jgi:hypothetical protein